MADFNANDLLRVNAENARLKNARASTVKVLRRVLEYCRGPNDEQQTEICDLLRKHIKELETP